MQGQRAARTAWSMPEDVACAGSLISSTALQIGSLHEARWDTDVILVDRCGCCWMIDPAASAIPHMQTKMQQDLIASGLLANAPAKLGSMQLQSLPSTYPEFQVHWRSMKRSTIHFRNGRGCASCAIIPQPRAHTARSTPWHAGLRQMEAHACVSSC